MLSLKVFDRSHCEELLEAHRRAAALILEALLAQRSAGDESDLASFRQSIGGVLGRMTSPDSKMADVLVAAGAATTAIHEYNRHVETAVRARRLELEAVVGMLTQTMSDVAVGSGQSLDRLKTIERRLAKSQEMFDVRQLRQEMSECLAGVKEESACRRRESERLIADLQSTIEEHARERRLANPPEHSREGSGHDPIEETIALAAKDDPSLLVAVLVVDHLKPVAIRFGEPAALKVVAYCAGQAREHRAGARQVIAWKGSSCVALMDGADGALAAEWAVSHEAQQRRTMTLEVSGREVMLHITYSKWLLLPFAGRTAAALVENMNSFLAQVALAPKTA